MNESLRHFLTNCGFRLPGEAQKIDRIMDTFAQCYWEDNAGDHGRCPYSNKDTVFLIAFAIIMLNTDLHKTSNFTTLSGKSISKHKQRKKMTKSEFLNNLRGVDNSEDIPREYLSQIYDSIEANPIAINEPAKLSKGKSKDINDLIESLVQSVKPSQELLRGLAVHDHRYLAMSKYKGFRRRMGRSAIPEDLVRGIFGATWHHFHSVINTVLYSAHLDPKGLENCLDVLKSTLCATICLDLTTERNAFTTQLVRVKFFRENRGLEEDEKDCSSAQSHLQTPRNRYCLDYKNDTWYRRIERAAESYNENAKMTALDEVDDMFHKLHASLKVDHKLKREMVKVTTRIRNGQILLSDPTRYFVKEGTVVKKCNRSGRSVKYTFFLFSDVLIYSHKTSSGDYKIHEELPLHLLKIIDLGKNATGGFLSQKQRKSFHVIHPKKSFLTLVESVDEKNEWVKIINNTIRLEVKRKAQIEGARQAAAAIDR